MTTAKPKATIGTMACLCCGESVPVKQSEGGTLNFSCTWCDFPGYAKAGTEARRLILKKTKLLAPEPAPSNAKASVRAPSQSAPGPEPAPAVKGPAAPAPAARKPSTIFG